MDHSLFSERQHAATPRQNPFRTILCWLSEARARRRRRMALARLLEVHPALLKDIGVEPQVIAAAMTVSHAHAASFFDERQRVLQHKIPSR